MGSFLSTVGSPKRRILMMGLDSAGKTTVQSRMAGEDPLFNIPTIGFNLEHVAVGPLKLQIWDIGGQSGLRDLWMQYLQDTTHCVVFVVDSADHERMPEARRELRRLLAAGALRGMALLVLANKQDLDAALSPLQVAEKLGVLAPCPRKQRSYGREYCTTEEDMCGLHDLGSVQVLPVVAKTGQGLEEALTWLLAVLRH